MSKTIYITGDRSIDPLTAVAMTAAVINKAAVENMGDFDVITGDAETGIERAVRYLVPTQKLTVVNRTKTDEGHVDFDAAHQSMTGIVDEVQLIHTSPLDSRIGKSAIAVFGDEKVKLALQDS